MKRYIIQVNGRVQGVNFRRFAAEMASKMGVKGFVMNQADGSVLIDAQADEELLSQFMDKCMKGPSLAKVKSMCCVEEVCVSYSEFEIRYQKPLN